MPGCSTRASPRGQLAVHLRVLDGLRADPGLAVLARQDAHLVVAVAQVLHRRAPGELIAAARRVRRVDVADREYAQRLAVRRAHLSSLHHHGHPCHASNDTARAGSGAPVIAARLPFRSCGGRGPRCNCTGTTVRVRTRTTSSTTGSTTGCPTSAASGRAARRRSGSCSTSPARRSSPATSWLTWAAAWAASRVPPPLAAPGCARW